MRLMYNEALACTLNGASCRDSVLEDDAVAWHAELSLQVRFKEYVKIYDTREEWFKNLIKPS